MPRKKITSVLTGVVVISSILTQLSVAAAQPIPKEIPKDKLFDQTIIVKYKESSLNSSDLSKRKRTMIDIAARLLTQHGVTAIHTFPIFGVQIFRLELGHLDAVILALRSHPDVQYANYNFRIVGAQNPNDPNDPRWLQGALWGLEKIGMRTAWDYQTDASNIIVAVIDSGIDYFHPDLALNMWTEAGLHGFDFCPGSETLKDEIGHGTKVAGIIGARGNNNFGTVGADWKVQLLALKALCGVQPNGEISGGVGYAIGAMDKAMEKGAHIINNSWRLAPSVDPAWIPVLQDAVGRTNCQGSNIAPNCRPALFVAAAGNWLDGDISKNSDDCRMGETDCNGKVYPANYQFDNVIAVAAMDCTNSPTCTNNHIWNDSHFGTSTVHIAAPGAQIESTYLWNAASPSSGYDGDDGTSMAAPHVSGCAALLQARKWSRSGALLTIAELKNLLFSNADSSTIQVIGGRSLNCARAIAAIP